LIIILSIEKKWIGVNSQQDWGAMVSSPSNNNDNNREDVLKTIFQKQKELHQSIMTYSPPFDSQYSKKFLFLSKEERLSVLCTAIIHEAVELQRLTNWKWWKKAIEFNEQQAKEELIDLWHFIVDASIELEMTPQDILDEYTKKNQINKDRQKNHY
jgi:dimeric dUTPase (all-alpha-NTP-PPase superfamily)